MGMTDTTVEKGTISVKQVHEALFELHRQGADALSLLRQAGIAPQLTGIKGCSPREPCS